MAHIYMLEFPNGKRYIGATTQLLEARFRKHKSDAQKNRAYLYQAWREHGEPTLRILCEVEKCDLPRCEKAAILSYGTFGEGGYNSTPDGVGGDRKGRPTLDNATDLKRYQVLLDPPTVEAALDAGKGNLSLGLRVISKTRPADALPNSAKY